MSRFAGLFPGQLSEKAGMGEAFAKRYGYVADLFEAVARRSGVDLSRTFFGEGAPNLHDDEPAQVGVFAVSLAALEVLYRELGLRPACVAGYSLGTYAAFVAAGSLEWGQALDVLLEAERLLRPFSGTGRMGYVIGLTRDDLEARLQGLALGEAVTIGNENAAQQLVLTGEAAAVERAIASLAPFALRAEMLPIRHPMHSARLAPVAERLEAFVARLGVSEPRRAALYAPMLGRKVDGAAEAAAVLARQLARPSHWHAVLRGMSDEGVDRFAEIGPGDVLSKMLRFTLRGARPAVVEDPETAASFAFGMAAGKSGEPLSENA